MLVAGACRKHGAPFCLLLRSTTALYISILDLLYTLDTFALPGY